MEINVKWTGKILNLPASVSDFAPDASREELIVIIGLFSCAEYFDAFDKYIDIFSVLWYPNCTNTNSTDDAR